MSNSNKERGFFRLIVVIVVGLVLMKYFNVSASDILDWIKNFLTSIFSTK